MVSVYRWACTCDNLEIIVSLLMQLKLYCASELHGGGGGMEELAVNWSLSFHKFLWRRPFRMAFLSTTSVYVILYGI
jgi:hypothetical protein